jgi:hypothetical protein
MPAFHETSGWFSTQKAPECTSLTDTTTYNTTNIVRNTINISIIITTTITIIIIIMVGTTTTTTTIVIIIIIIITLLIRTTVTTTTIIIIVIRVTIVIAIFQQSHRPLIKTQTSPCYTATTSQALRNATPRILSPVLQNTHASGRCYPTPSIRLYVNHYT